MSDTLTTYHGDPKVKASLLRRISAHEKADRLTQGTYGSMNGHWRGCAVSCSLATRNGTFNGEQVTDGLHAEYPKQLGLPEWLAYLEDGIFEGLPKEEAMQWPRRFAEAIPVGVSLDGLADELAIARLREECLPLSGKWPESIRAEVVAAIEQVIAALEGKADRSAAESAAESAWAAAWSARSAAWSAAWSAGSARSAARSARSAAGSAAWSAAESAWAAAWSARSAAWSAAGSAAESAGSARSAARSARSAARSAAWSAAESAESAERAARSAAYTREANRLIAALEARGV
jgi:hypothetical protein